MKQVKHLDKGSHASAADGMCFMEAVAYVAGEPFSDHPSCACPVIAAFCRNLNDALPDESRQALIPYVKKLVGTRSTPEVERRRAHIAADFAVRSCAADAMQVTNQSKHAKALRKLEPIVDQKTATYAAAAAANAAAYAAYAAAYATYAAADAAYAAANAAAYAANAAAYAATYAANRDDYLLIAGGDILDAMLSVTDA